MRLNGKSSRSGFSIITVGLSPAWDITCVGQNLNWFLHKEIDGQTVQPAGKALNVSKALAWMGQKNIAAGLWGRSDYQQMLTIVRSLWPLIEVKMTPVPGSTRRNVTIIDKANKRDMHLRSRSGLASAGALRRLRGDLRTLVNENSVCILAGAMPETVLLGDVVRIVKDCRLRGSKIVLDTSGPALRQILDTGCVWLIKPNVEELGELLGGQVQDSPAALAWAGQKLLDRVEIILISRGKKGAVLVTEQGALWGRSRQSRKERSTVGCGDYLLAGFLKGFRDNSDLTSALKTALKVAAVKAWDWLETKKWPEVQRQIKVESGMII